MKRALNIFFIILVVGFLILLFIFRGSMNRFISTKMKDQAGAGIRKSVAQTVDSAFNYQKNGEGFAITFLEFGATGCISCRKMELVMKEVNEKYPTKVNVRFYNILLPENQDMMKYFGISAIPTQVLLDVSGKEVFRHTGYFAFDDLNKEFQKIIF